MANPEKDGKRWNTQQCLILDVDDDVTGMDGREPFS
jgi:hypothetical protein